MDFFQESTVMGVRCKEQLCTQKEDLPPKNACFHGYTIPSHMYLNIRRNTQGNVRPNTNEGECRPDNLLSIDHMDLGLMHFSTQSRCSKPRSLLA